MGNAACSSREVFVTTMAHDLWAEVLYVETLTSSSDAPSDALIEIPVGGGLTVTSFSADVNGEERHVTGAVKQRARRRFTAASEPGAEETVTVELCKLPPHATVRIRVAAVARVVPAPGGKRATLSLPARAVGRDDPSSLTVALEASFSRPLASTTCSSHKAAGIKAKGKNECAVLLRSKSGLEGRDFDVEFTFAEERLADAVVEPGSRERACLVSLVAAEPLHSLIVDWPASFGIVRQSPDAMCGKVDTGDHVVIGALFDGQEDPKVSEATLTVTVSLASGDIKNISVPIRKVSGSTIVHQLAARETASWLTAGVPAGSPMARNAQGKWAMQQQDKQEQWRATLKHRLITLGVRWGLVTPYTAFAAEEEYKGREGRTAVFCRNTGCSGGLKLLDDVTPGDGTKKSCTLPTGQNLGAMSKSIRRDLEAQGKRELSEHVVDLDDRVIRGITHPETRRLEIPMLFGEGGIPSVALLRRHFAQQGALSCEAAEKLILDAAAILRSEPNVLELSSPISVCGDIHGQYYDMLSMLKANGYPSPENKYLFLGDYVDRGLFSTECLLLLCAMKIEMPTCVYMIRGNHETRLLSQTHTFETECDHKYNYDVCCAFEFLFDSLPLAATVKNTPAGTCFCVHGGIGPTLQMVSDINTIDRFREVPEEGLFCDLLWSDPLSEWNPSSREFKFMLRSEWDNVEFMENRSRKLSYYYGPRAVQRFLRDNDLGCIVRGHQVQKMGYMEHFVKDDSQLAPVLTVFTAPNYCDKYGNRGALLKLTADGFKIRRFRESPHPFILPSYMDGITYSLPFFMDQLAVIFQVIAYSVRTEKRERTPEEVKADEALEAKIRALKARKVKLQQQQDEYLSINKPSYHKNMSLFDRVLIADAVNEGKPLKNIKVKPTSGATGLSHHRTRCDSLSSALLLKGTQ